MHPTIDDIDFQARQGSVAAIIQILNEHFAEEGIRTRAIQDSGILQLLVEAPSADALPREAVVDQVRHVLETISPRGISRVNINSRIVQEQQLLWLDEIKRDPENSLLWSEPIVLKRPNPAARLWRDLRAPRQRNPFLDDVYKKKPTSSRSAFWRGIIGGASLALLLLLVGWATKDWLGVDLRLNAQDDSSSAADPAPAPAAPVGQDPFVLAVRIAQQSVEDGKSATTAAEWLDLAVRWQRAADLMGEVPPEDERYAIAQDRVQTYSANKAMALMEAEKF
ncbi:hypothetical protein IQ265_08160 [Nodosilinea sp. LEGE 06152]|uniref:hypothetical protein n=1 Tax=Nodosilinea sp. LEGE 06152 TaxID=2777966 RepID=UPI00188120C2|nr:hypothetical protein [Nodosilinea sp. LEGE 06152]MBE9156802.1 hypothetical protein [Nodosilinea sp. LEGE 06152]